MKPIPFFTLIALSILSTSCSHTQNVETQIVWDTWGVPHISADNIEDLFYAQGWSQMHNHANLILWVPKILYRPKIHRNKTS